MQTYVLNNRTLDDNLSDSLNDKKIPPVVHDLAGIGIGPFNLSLAALLSQVSGVKSIFFDAKPCFNWHEDLLFDDANITVSYLKDLVTLADPTNPFSFMSFLHQKKRIYRYIINDQQFVRRLEFNQYLKWVAESIDFLNFSSPIIDLKYLGDRFEVTTDKQQVYHAKNIAIGCGRVPKIPDLFKPHIGSQVFPPTHVKDNMLELKNKVVAIVGGGQTGAEILLQILSDKHNLPEKIYWISSRNNIAPLDDSPYANELYVPSYAQYHSKQDKETRNSLVRDNLLTADGIAEDVLKGIYNRLYDIEVIGDKPICEYVLGSRVSGIEKSANQYLLSLNKNGCGESSHVMVDKTILCLGFESKMPAFIENFAPQIPLEDGKFMLNDDFSVDWSGSETNKIYALNAGRHHFGLAESNFALMAWRSATITNSVAQREVHDTHGFGASMQWGAPPAGIVNSMMQSSGF